MLSEFGRAGSAGAPAVVEGTAALVVATEALGTAADDVAPAPARSQGFGGDAPLAMLDLYSPSPVL